MADTNGKASEPTGLKDGLKNNRKLATGVAVGIGSAAIVAALMYANRPKRPETRD